MPNQVEYAIAFDTDTQQDVVLVRRKNTNQPYQKYVFDEKLDRFEKLPEEKKEDKSEKSTPQFLPLPPQDNSPLSRLLTRLTDPASDSITIKLDNALEMVKELQVQLESVNRSSSLDVADENAEEPADFSDEDACSDDSFSTAPEQERLSSPESADFELVTASGKEDKIKTSDGQGIAQEAGPERQDSKSALSDPKNDHQQPSTSAFNYASPAVAAAKVQETGTTVYHLLAAKNLAKRSAMFARKRSNVGFEGSDNDEDRKSTRTALEPSDFDSEDSEVEDESYDESSEYSDEEEEESGSDGDESMDQESSDIASGAQNKVQKPGEPASDSCQEQEQVQEHTQKPFVTRFGSENDNQELEMPAAEHEIEGESGEIGEVKQSRSDPSTATSSTPAAVPEPSDEESEESEYSDEQSDESDSSDEEEEESDSDGDALEEQEQSEDAQKASATESGPENIESGSLDLKEDGTTASDAPAAANNDQEVKSCSADLTNSHQQSPSTASAFAPPVAPTDDQEVKIKDSNPSGAADDDQLSTTTAMEPSEYDSDESEVEDESYDGSECSDEEEEEYSDEEENEESENDASMDQEPSANILHSEKIAAETATATGAQDIRLGSSDSKDDRHQPTTTASEPVLLVAATDVQEVKIKATAAESEPLVAATEDLQALTLTPSPTGAALPGPQEVTTTNSSTPAVPEPSDHESDESDVEDESYDDSEYSDEEEEESDDDSDYSDEEEEESDGLEEQEQSDTASGPEDTKSGPSDPKNNHHEPESTVSSPAPLIATTDVQKIKIEAFSHSKAKVDDQITALKPSGIDSEDSEVEDESYDESEYSDEEEEESDDDVDTPEEQEKPGDAQRPADTESGQKNAKTCSSDLQNDHQEHKATVAATKAQETGTTVYHLLAARNLANNAAMLSMKYSGGVLEGSDAESTRTALEPSEYDYDDSDVEDESYDESDYSDEEEEETGSDGDEPMDQEQPGAGQEPSGAQDKNQKPGEPASGNQEGSGSGPTSSSDKKKIGTRGSNDSGGTNDPSSSSDDEPNESEMADEDSNYSDEEEEESDYDADGPEEQKHSDDSQKLEEEPIQGSGSSQGSETSTTETPNLPKTVLSNDIFPICLKQCHQLRQFTLHAMNLITQEIGAYILGKDGNLEEVQTPLKLNFRNYSEFKKGDWVIGNGEVNYVLDENSRLQKLEYSQERKTFVKCEHGVVKMLAEEEVNAPPSRVEEDDAVSVRIESNDSENEDESDGSEETGDDMEDEEVSDEEDPFVYNPGARQEEPVQGDPDESLPTARPIRFRAPFLQAVNLNDTANMSDIPLTSPDESFAETSGDDSQYCVMTNDDVLLTKHQKDPNQNCCIS